MKSPWTDYLKEPPKKHDYYLTQRMDCETGSRFYAVDYFEPQNEYEKRFSKEFNQEVEIKVRSQDPSFDDSYSVVLYWMEIPK